MKSKLRRYERTAKGTGKRINGIGVQQAAGDAMKRNQLFSQMNGNATLLNVIANICTETCDMFIYPASKACIYGFMCAT